MGYSNQAHAPRCSERGHKGTPICSGSLRECNQWHSKAHQYVEEEVECNQWHSQAHLDVVESKGGMQPMALTSTPTCRGSTKIQSPYLRGTCAQALAPQSWKGIAGSLGAVSNNFSPERESTTDEIYRVLSLVIPSLAWLSCRMPGATANQLDEGETHLITWTFISTRNTTFQAQMHSFEKH